MRFIHSFSVLFFILYSLLSAPASGVSSPSKKGPTMSTDDVHVQSWNQFAEELYRFHSHQLNAHKIRTEEEFGGYAGLPEFYREVRYFDADTNRLLSRIQWERTSPDTIHVIEVFVYDKQGTLKSDYLAAFLPEYRNAPVQTLINVHFQNDELHSFRQFDASGARIHEQCEGKHFDEPVMISLDEDDFDSTEAHIVKVMLSNEYLTCFEFTPSIVNHYISPFKTSGITTSQIIRDAPSLNDGMLEADEFEKKLERLSNKIKVAANPGSLYIKRGQIYFTLHKFDRAIQDYTRALELDKSLDEAYFGRGMAKGRIGQVSQGIEDLSEYISRNPNSSLAYTKRGVRYIWAGDLSRAKRDLQRAIKIDPANAEAHDDLGVVYASEKNLKQSLFHFKTVVKLDPSYVKGFHNLAMTYFITGQHTDALKNINAALKISPNNKNSLLLKGEILASLGMDKEAQTVIERAEFLPEGNWSERFSVR